MLESLQASCPFFLLLRAGGHGDLALLELDEGQAAGEEQDHGQRDRDARQHRRLPLDPHGQGLRPVPSV